MTIQGLWQVLDELGQSQQGLKETKIWEELGQIVSRNEKGTLEYRLPRRIAVDLSLWIYHATGKRANGVRQDLIANRVIFYRICRLLEHGFFPIFVYDGERPWFKLGCDDSARTFDCPQWIVDFLKAFDLPVLQAKGEAEAECVQLYKCGYVDDILTDDCDAFAFGAHTIMRNRAKDEKTPWTKVDVYNLNMCRPQIGPEILRWCAVLCQTDYGSGHRSVGIRTALDLGLHCNIASHFDSLIQSHKNEILSAFSGTKNLKQITHRLQHVRDKMESIISYINQRRKCNANLLNSFSTNFRKVVIPLVSDAEDCNYFPNWGAVAGYYFPTTWTESELKTKSKASGWNWMHETQFRNICLDKIPAPCFDKIRRHLTFSLNWSEDTFYKKWNNTIQPILFLNHLRRQVLRVGLNLPGSANVQQQMQPRIVKVRKTTNGRQDYQLEWIENTDRDVVYKRWVDAGVVELAYPKLRYDGLKRKHFDLVDDKRQTTIDNYFRSVKRSLNIHTKGNTNVDSQEEVIDLTSEP